VLKTRESRQEFKAQLLLDGGIGDQIYEIASEIYPICRSITGDGVRKTLSLLKEHVDLKVAEVPTGTRAFDWTVPREWNIRDAFVKNTDGERVIDVRKSNLHVLSYSTPIHAEMSLEELRPHLFTIPDQPDVIPYRTSYYSPNWGFCLSHNQMLQLQEGRYEVCVDSTLEDGHLTYGEFFLPGESEQEVLLTAHICHPSLANDNCSGLATLTQLAKRISLQKPRYSYRFLFAPGTIGAITWLGRNEDKVGNIKHGLVVSCLGDGGGPTYKKSRRGNAVIDRAASHVLKHATTAPNILDFSPYGYDERQYCSPGFDLPVGLLQRSQFGCFPEYHTSADNLSFIEPLHLASSYGLIVSVLDVLERNWRPVSTNPKCEPQLGRRGLYQSVGGYKHTPESTMAMLWVMNLADGRYSLLDMAERANVPFELIADAAELLHEGGLLTGYERTAVPADG